MARTVDTRRKSIALLSVAEIYLLCLEGDRDAQWVYRHRYPDVYRLLFPPRITCAGNKAPRNHNTTFNYYSVKKQTKRKNHHWTHKKRHVIRQ